MNKKIYRRIKTNEGSKIMQMIVKTGMALTAAVDILLLAGLVFNVLTYEKTGFLFVGMAVLIVLVIIYMQVEPYESPDEIMESYMKEREGENIRIHDQYGNDGRGVQNLYNQEGSGGQNLYDQEGSGDQYLYDQEDSSDQYLYDQEDGSDHDKYKYNECFHDSIGASVKAAIPMNNAQGGDIDVESVLLSKEILR